MPKSNQNTKSIISRFYWTKPYIAAIIIFTVFLFAVPQIVALSVGCLAPTPGSSYTYQECNILLVLDRFIFIALIGVILLIISVFILVYPRMITRLIAVSALFAVMTVISYYLFLGKAEGKINSAPVLTDTVMKP